MLLITTPSHFSRSYETLVPSCNGGCAHYQTTITTHQVLIPGPYYDTHGGGEDERRRQPWIEGIYRRYD
jgi:hypothetical protein